MVRFRQMNLTEPWTAVSKVDIVFMRNVLIYFDAPTKKAILWRLRTIMPVDGTLFLGSAETTLSIDPAVSPVTHERATYYKIGAAS